LQAGAGQTLPANPETPKAFFFIRCHASPPEPRKRLEK